MSVSIVNYGLGNIGSVRNMFKRLGVETRTIETADEVRSSDRVLLPGVGSFDNAVTKLQDRGLDDALRDFAGAGRPLFGICLGMQLLLDRSEEGTLPGLGLIPGHSERFRESPGVRIPHMGWNIVAPQRADDGLVAELPEESRFYFVHSYRVVPDSPEAILGMTEYGGRFASMIRTDNVMGAQYHPEKSHAFGMRVLRNFSEL